MDTEFTVSEPEAEQNHRWNRLKAAQVVVDFEAKRLAISLSEFSRQTRIARTTMQGWIQRKANLSAPADEIAFFESPAGQRFLHRLHVAAHLTINQEGAGGIRRVSLLLERAGLAPFIGTSYGAQHDAAAAMEEHILE